MLPPPLCPLPAEPTLHYSHPLLSNYWHKINTARSFIKCYLQLGFGLFNTTKKHQNSHPLAAVQPFIQLRITVTGWSFSTLDFPIQQRQPTFEYSTWNKLHCSAHVEEVPWINPHGGIFLLFARKQECNHLLSGAASLGKLNKVNFYSFNQKTDKQRNKQNTLLEPYRTTCWHCDPWSRAQRCPSRVGRAGTACMERHDHIRKSSLQLCCCRNRVSLKK